jgi:hypothetical protein
MADDSKNDDMVDTAGGVVEWEMFGYPVPGVWPGAVNQDGRRVVLDAEPDGGRTHAILWRWRRLLWNNPHFFSLRRRRS